MILKEKYSQLIKEKTHLEAKKLHLPAGKTKFLMQNSRTCPAESSAPKYAAQAVPFSRLVPKSQDLAALARAGMFCLFLNPMGNVSFPVGAWRSPFSF